MIWTQTYDPLGSRVLSTLMAAVPVVTLLGCIAFLRIRIHLAALLGVAMALAVALFGYGMPWSMALGSAGYGAAYGLFPIGWIILNVIFLYQLTVERKLFAVLRDSLAALAPDPRVQLILVAFSFGAFIEGVAGFGAPVAITGAILIQLGFRPLQASGLALIANTAPVAFGSLGIPITTLSQITGMDALALSKMVGRQLPFFSVIVPFWVVAAYSGWRGAIGIWPAVVTGGVAFAIPQFLVSNFHGPWLVDMVSAACSIAAMTILLRLWQPSDGWKPADGAATNNGLTRHPRRQVALAWMPWLLLTVFLFAWGLPPSKAWMEGRARATAPSAPPAGPAAARPVPPTKPERRTTAADWLAPEWKVPGLHARVQRSAPVAPPGSPPEKAAFRLNWLSGTGTGILLAAVCAGLLLGIPLRTMLRVYGATLWKVRFSLLTIAGMLALGNITKYSGTDATLGLALAQTGALYPFFGTLLGWLGVALTGSDTASNVLFGSLQKISAEQAGINPILMGAANSSGGVMGKMIDAQSIVVAGTATGYHGHEGEILRFVFWHSLALATMVGVLVFLQAAVPPFTHMVPLAK